MFTPTFLDFCFSLWSLPWSHMSVLFKHFFQQQQKNNDKTKIQQKGNNRSLKQFGEYIKSSKIKLAPITERVLCGEWDTESHLSWGAHTAFWKRFCAQWLTNSNIQNFKKTGSNKLSINTKTGLKRKVLNHHTNWETDPTKRPHGEIAIFQSTLMS